MSSGKKGNLITQTQIKDFYKDKKILVVGGTGTIGSKIVETLLEYEPAVIRIYSRDEFKQYMLSYKYADKEQHLRYLIGDVRDYDRLITAAKDIDIIFNLAAMKHVPACEYNPFEAVKTNVLGTQNVIRAAISCGASQLVFTSSDKAISPTNAMGATKLLAERLLIAADNMRGNADIAMSAVRFGSVMGSRGSVVPMFVEQIRNEGKLTVTDKEMTRFMMSKSDAVSLTIQAAAIAKGGEIFVLKMPNIKLSDLAEAVIELTCEKYGINPETIRMEQIGLRPGEKMYEELMTDHELLNAYELPGMYAIVPSNYRHTEMFKDIPLAGAKSYSSNDTEVISKEEVRQLLIREKLI